MYVYITLSAGHERSANSQKAERFRKHIELDGVHNEPAGKITTIYDLGLQFLIYTWLIVRLPWNEIETEIKNMVSCLSINAC